MTNNKLSDNKIIKALECCAKSSWLNDCDGCPCFDPKEDIQTSECQERLMKYALDLINSQKAEIERLKKDKYKLQKALNQSEDYRVIAKAEAYKEFVERLKEMATQGFWETDAYVGAEQIDNLVKEFEKKENTTYDD